MTNNSEHTFDKKINLFLSKEIYYFTLFFLIIILYIYGKGQISHTFARLDDWEFMINLPPGMEGHGSPWDKTLWEGRWINFLWSKVAVHLTLKEIYLVFLVGYATFCWIASSFISMKKIERFIISILFFLCPEYANLSLWPATLSPSIWIAAFTLLAYKLKPNKILIYILFTLDFMAYPPVAPICLLFVCLSAYNYKTFFTYIILYLIAYITGVLVIYTLNYIYHDIFGLQLADWRHEHKIKNIHDIIFNFKKATKQLYSVYFGQYHYIHYLFLSVCISIALGLKLNKLLKFAAILILLIIIDFSIPLVLGTDVISRSVLWPWFLIIAVLYLNPRGLNYKYSAIITLIFSFTLIIQANIFWNSNYSITTKRTELIEYYGKLLLSTNQDKIFFCGNLSKTLPFYNTPYWESNMPFIEQIWKEYNVQLVNYPHCNQINTLGLSKINNTYILKIN